LSEALGERLDYYSETIDVTRVPDGTYVPALAEFMRRKYAGVRPDLVIANGITATDFVAAEAPTLFPDAQVVFTGVAATARPVPESTGLLSDLEMKRSVDLARQLQPGLRRVFVVTGVSPFDAHYTTLAREQLKAVRNLEITFLDGLSADQ
ncbi:hypothetical protein, partial [Pseudomonas aeruginosa]|uniref:hypothetical protein n=1 Tax=Pseudomonas aeruginosa TaxID=287 RepID=UPI002F906DB2